VSQYESYSTASVDYDNTRVSVGVETILGMLTRTNVPLGSQSVLEAGCGTGNYLQALRPHLGNLQGIDFNEGMLKQARAKLGDDVELSCGSILEMPYEDNSFDGVVCNQVIHHLEKGPGAADDPAEWQSNGFPNISAFIHEANRVLRPGGAFVLNTTSHLQFPNGYWWADLIPAAVARLRCRLPDLDDLRKIITEAGIEIESVTPDLDGILQGNSYLDPRGPLNESWRAGDSTWSLVSDAELAASSKRVEKMNLEGTMQDYIDQREAMRREVGQSTFFCCRK
jgi:ubiquinone/menaquinone biosynthesis C-methylase UbiE